ncbi:ribonuclease P protein component [Treponema sp. OMZ 840]|uniref:ribonuclease P protein component n=1 Tax=Treponema sp. OMZ 840 TaxID=244313 RepID=UPI003D8DF680
MEKIPYKTGSFCREERIKKNNDIQKLFKKGKRVSTDGAKLFFLFTGKNINRIAFALPRGYGNAVQRNRCKRLSREVYRLLKTNMHSGYDMVLLVYPGQNSFKNRYAKVKELCGKAGLFMTA